MKRLAFVLMVLGCVAQADAATTLTTEFGQIFNWTGDKTIGTYADGSYYIVSATNVSFTSKTPSDTDAAGGYQHGCMVNPTPQGFAGGASFTHMYNDGAHDIHNAQGWDSRLSGLFYSDTLNVADTFPFTVNAGQSLVCADSNTVNCPVAAYPLYMGCLDVVEVINVVSSAPASGSFRPAWAGTDKTIRGNVSDIRYSVFQDLTVSSTQPALATVQALFHYPTTIWGYNANAWVQTIGQSAVPYLAYGRAMWYALGDVLVCMHGAYSDAQKLPCAINLAQAGIDMYGLSVNGMYWLGGGGFCFPAKSLIFHSAVIINNATMIAKIDPANSQYQFCEDTMFFTVSQSDVSTARTVDCGDNSPYAGPGTACLPFTSADIGRPYYSATQHLPGFDLAVMSRYFGATYHWMVNSMVIPALSVRWLANEAQWKGNEFLTYIFDQQNTWEDNRFFAQARTWWAGGCNSTNVNGNGTRTSTCFHMDNNYNTAPISGTVTGVVSSNVLPTIALTTPTSSQTQITTASTIGLGGTAADSDGTVSSISVTADCDASITPSGTTSWTATVDLPANTACVVSITATDNSAGVSNAITVNVLRTSNTCGLSDTFSLTGSWSTANPYCYTGITGGLLWTNNTITSTAAQRNFAYYNTNVSQDVTIAATVSSTPAANNWPYVGGRATIVSSSDYSFVRVTAEVDHFSIAQYTNGTQGAIETVAVVPVLNDTFSVRFVSTAACILRNGATITDGTNDGCITTSLTGTKAVFGCWGVACSIDNLVITNAAGGDTTNPLLSIVTPATNPLIVIATPYTLAAGTATDAVGVTTCTWLVLEFPSVNGSCGGTALPATNVSWTIASIALSSAGAGENTIQVTVMDAAGNTAVASSRLRYIPGGPSGTYTYPNAESTWTQRGRIVELAGTFTASACDYVLLSGVGDPLLGGGSVVATGTDTWLARVALVPGENSVTISCMDDAGTVGNISDDTHVVDRVKVITSIKNRKWM